MKTEGKALESIQECSANREAKKKKKKKAAYGGHNTQMDISTKNTRQYNRYHDAGQ